MRRLPWNSCTTFAAIGSALAYLILIPTFGLYWELVPGGIAGLIAAYAVSTVLGVWFATINIGQHLAHRIVAGVGAALVTLLAGALAIATTNFLTQMGIEIVRSPAGQPFWNVITQFVPGNVGDFIVQPVLTGLLYGQWPAVILGITFGATLQPTLPTVQAATVPASANIYIASSGGVFMALLFAGTTMLVTNGQTRSTHVPVGVPVAIGGCGSAPVSDGVLGFCPGSPCEEGFCQWDTEIDAIAVFVLPPANSPWEWTGGGMGNTSAPHIVRHNTSWVQPGPNGYFDGSNPHRDMSYEFRFDGENVRLKRYSFEFTPGMLLVIRYSDDWSYTVGVGRDALRGTGVAINELQGKLDELCLRFSLFSLCEKSFQITVENGRN